MRLLLCCLLVLGVSTACFAAPTGPSFADWTKHRDALAKDPDVVRFYVFGEAKDAKAPVPSLAGGEAPLRYGVQPAPGEPEESPRQTGGRFAERQAVQLNRGIYSAPQFDVEKKSFSVEAWVRTHGQGALKGDQPTQSGTLLSQGNGYWDGWRITLSYPDRILGMEMGKRPGSFGIRTTTPVSDGVWHHLVITWNGERVRLYVDGLEAASGEYAGGYVKPAEGATFRLGFANAGWGSILSDYDQVVVYKRALSSVEVLQHTLYYAPLAKAVAEKLEAADKAFAANGLAGAMKGYTELMQLSSVHLHWAAVFGLRMAQVYQQEHRYTKALEAYVAVMQTPGLPEGLQMVALSPVMQLALQSPDVPAAVFDALLKRIRTLPVKEQVALRMNLARSLAQAGKAAAAAKAYGEVLSMAEMKPRDKLEVALQMGHSFAGARRFAQARAEYAKIAGSPDAPASHRSYAMLCAARTHRMEKKWPAARAEYARVAKLADAPEVHRWEGAEGLREVARLEKGLAPRDPAWGRVQLPPRPAPAVQLYVSPKGSDSGAGTKEAPFATLDRARDAVRGLVKKGLQKGGVAVNLGPGEYRRSESLKLDAADSGTKDAPVVWRAVERGKAILTGGRAVAGFTRVTDPAILERLPEEARGKVVQLGLKTLGITEYGELKPRGFSHGGGTPAMELFADGQPLTPARWPNEGFARAKSVVSNDDKGAVFTYEDDRPARWAKAKDAWIFGYWKWQWADSRDPILEMDTQARTIRLPKVTYGGIDAGAPYFVYNLLEEIDQPGEWYVDRASGVLYLYPAGDAAGSDYRLSLLPTPLVSLDGASFVTLEGLTLEYGQGTGIDIKEGERCLVAGCTIRNLSGDGVIINGGSGHGVLSCDLYNLGRGGARVTGGDRKTLAPGGHFVENCDVHHFSRVDRTYTPAVHLDGCGSRIAHNEFHETPCHAMRIEGNDHVIELNDVHDVVRESDDQGGVDMWFNPSYRGVVFRYNYWHDIGTPYHTHCGQAGIRLDDAISGILIYGNVFQRCSTTQFGAIQLHGGKEDVIVNNVFADCRYGISFSPWGAEGWKRFLDSQGVKDAIYKAVDITQPPYSTRYPALAHLAENEGVHQIWRNVVFGCSEFLTRDRGVQDLMDNTVTLKDPGFTNAEARDFTLKPDSPLLRMPGFRPIPFAEIGLYGDSYRARK